MSRPPRVFLYDGCQTCRQAKKWLATQGFAFEAIDIVTSPPTRDDLRQALLRGWPLKKLFNTSGQSYREGRWAERLPTITEEDALGALATDGKLIKRPFVLGKDFALVGFDETAWRAAAWPKANAVRYD